MKVVTSAETACHSETNLGSCSSYATNEGIQWNLSIERTQLGPSSLSCIFIEMSLIQR